MADIFISYAREDRERVKLLANTLEIKGWSVFWDRTIPTGKKWREIIGEALENACVVIVAWSKASTKSRWVQEEADWGIERNILVPILIDDVKPPLGFGSIQAANLISWDPSKSSPEFEKLIGDISAILIPHPQKDEREKRKEELRRTEKRRNKKEVKAGIKIDKLESFKAERSEPKSSEPRKKEKFTKYALALGIIVFLVFQIWSYIQKHDVPTQIEDLEDKNPKVRLNAAKALGKIGPKAKAAVPALIKALNDKDSLVRRYAAGALGHIGPEAKPAVPYLIQNLKDQNLGICLSAAVALGGIGPEAKAAVPALIEALDDNHPAVRGTAAQAIGYIGPEAKAAVPYLIKMLKDQETTAGDAAQALGKIGPKAKAAVPALTAALNHYQPMVRTSAKTALEKIQSK